MKKASIIILIMLFSILAPFDFSGLNFSFAFGEEANASVQTNNLPMAVDDFYQTDANTQLTVAAPGVLGNDSDPDGDALLSAKLADPANGMVSMGTDGRFMYVPRADFTGTDSFTYTIYDGKGGSATATVIIAVASNATEEKQVSETVPLENETNSNSSDKKDSNGTTTDNSSNKDKEKKDANLSDEDKPKFVGEYGADGQPKTVLLATG
ncbi:MAG: cadherin-like domain-containing protein, partial [Methanofastidiosum sp.]